LAKDALRSSAERRRVAVRKLKEPDTMFYVYHIRSILVPNLSYTGFSQDVHQHPNHSSLPTDGVAIEKPWRRMPFGS